VSDRSDPVVRVVLAGVHGHGQWHLANLRRLSDRGIRVVGVCDPSPVKPERLNLRRGVVWAERLDELLSVTRPDVTIISTPIQTHTELALMAAVAGSHVLLEKPPAPSMVEYQRLLDEFDRTGVLCQVGFQALGSDAVTAIRALIAEGAVGRLRGIGAAAAVSRDARYYSRGPWAGRRRLNGREVVDGCLTNPFAHALAAALRLAGSETAGGVGGIELELHHAYDIEADDTSAVRLVTSAGILITVAATLASEIRVDPYVVVHGSHGRITWWYTRDMVRFEADGRVRSRSYSRSDLLENLVTCIHDPARQLLVPLASTGAFMEFMEAVRRAPSPSPIPPAYWRSEGRGLDRRRIVPGIDKVVVRSADELQLFSELALPWAETTDASADAAIAVGNRVVATSVNSGRVDVRYSPRPFLHPVCTLEGTVVTEFQPEDHRWHLGVGIAVPDVGGVNFWGGPTYVRGRGYVSSDDHGTVRHLRWLERTDNLLRQELGWFAPDQRCLMVEKRLVAATAVIGADRCWLLDFGFELRSVSDRPIELRSPATNGRAGAGYGGFFWRLPFSASPVRVFTDHAAGEAEINGSTAPWLAWVGDAGEPPVRYTVVLAPGDERTAQDRWFVRVADYPGIGSALAWDEPLELAPGETTARRLRAVVADGSLEDPWRILEQMREE
jgi:predicted dehydrogenase